jgi:hypothetical protein
MTAMNNTGRLGRTGLKGMCVGVALLLSGCGFLREMREVVFRDGYTSQLTEYRQTLQPCAKEPEEGCASERSEGEPSFHPNSRWDKTWSALSSAGYVVTVPADVACKVVSIPFLIPLFLVVEVFDMPT